jgi:NADP-dependent 3-hydroxy acid dehydrogenase YdfG
MNNNNTKRHYIVGGAGSGLGQAIALQLLQQGESVITVGRSVEKLQALQS